VSGARPDVAELFIRFTQVGVSGFGGVMPWARRMLVEERRWLSAEEFNEALSLCQVLPGPNIVNMAVCVGTRFRGALGAFAAFMGLMCAPFAIVLVLGALFICLIPTTIGGLLSAIGIAGMDRVARFNVLAMSGRAVEASGDVDVILLDKTGTITYGNRLAAAISPAPGVGEAEAVEAALQTSIRDETPEGRSVVELARKRLAELGATARAGDEAGFAQYRQEHWYEHRQFVAIGQANHPVILIPDYDLTTWQDGNQAFTTSWLTTHESVHEALRYYTGVTGINLADVNFAKEDEFYEWIDAHRQEHAALRKAFGITT